MNLQLVKFTLYEMIAMRNSVGVMWSPSVGKLCDQMENDLTKIFKGKKFQITHSRNTRYGKIGTIESVGTIGRVVIFHLAFGDYKMRTFSSLSSGKII